MGPDSPEHLFRRYLGDGDEATLAALFRRTAPPLRAFGRRLGLPTDRLEELVHETLVAAVQGAASFRADAPLLPWLHGILAKKAAAHHREELRRQHHHRTRPTPSPAEPEPWLAAAEDELRERLGAAIAGLPEQYRTVVDLHLRQGLSPAEIAGRTGQLGVTVRVHLHRGLQRLREQLPRGLFPLALCLWLGSAPRAATPSPTHLPLRLARWPWLAAAASAVLGGGLLLSLLWPPVDAIAQRPAAPTTTTAFAATPPALTLPDTAATGGTRTLVAATGNPVLTIAVRDPAGRPLPQVGLSLEPSQGSEALPHRRRLVTGADGLATTTLTDHQPHRVRSDRGHDELVAAAAGHLELVADGSPLHVQVVQPDGSPAAGLAVWLAADANTVAHGGVVDHTDAAGHCHLTAVRPGALVAAFGLGFGCAPLPVEGDHVRLVVGRAFPVTGSVRTPAGTPASGVTVVAGHAPDHAELGFPDGVRPCGWPLQLASSDADGRFGPLWLPAGRHELYARAPGHGPAHTTAEVGATCHPVVLELPAAWRLEGTVTAAQGLAADGAEVVFRSADRDQRCELHTTADGRFSLWLPAVAGHLAVRAPGHLPQRLRLAATPTAAPVAIHLTAADHHPLQLRLDGAPAAGWQLRVRLTAPSALATGERVVTADGDGRLSLPWSPTADGDAHLAVRGPGDPVWHPLANPAALLPGPLVDLPSAYRPTAALRGVVRDHRGEPLVRGRVYLRLGDGIAWESAATDDAGAFAVQHLAPGTYAVFVESRTRHQPSVPFQELQVPAHATTTTTLQAAPPGTLAFRLLREGGPPAAATVTVVGGQPPRRQAAFTESHGQQALPPGDYRLYAMGENFAWVDGEPFRIRAGATTTLELPVAPAVRRALALRGDLPPADHSCSVVLHRGNAPAPFARFTLAADAEPAVTAFLPCGDYTAVALDERGRRLAVATFAVTDLQPTPTATPVWFAAH